MNIMELDFPEIIRTFLTMSLTGSIIALILFIIKPIIKDRLPKSFQYYIWFVVFIALLLPLSNMIVLPESSISSRQTTPTPIYDTVQWISQTILEKPIHFISFSEIKAKPNNPQNQFISMATVIFIIWLFGAFIFLTSNIICYILFAQQLKKTNVCASSYEIELLNQLSGKGYHPHLYLNSTIHTPFLMGVFHPTIILPDKKYTNTQLQNIFLHELTHLCRYDIAIKWILIFLGAFHWYNPIIYFVRQEIDRACELACDEAVIKNLDLIGKQNYGNTLIEIAANNSSKIPLSITMSEDKKILKRRLNAIMKHTNFSKKAVILPSIFLIITLCGVFYISAVSSIDNTKNKVNITYADYTSLSKQTYDKKSELKKILCDFDKKNTVEIWCFLENLEDDIIYANVFIVGHEEVIDSTKKYKLMLLVSENLNLDTQNVYIEYMDVKTFTSPKNKLHTK